MAHNSRFEMLKRSKANGIAKFKDYTVDDKGKMQLLKSECHTVTYTLCRNKSIIVAYKQDENSDMFQVES